jgi:hypothetical protein
VVAVAALPQLVLPDQALVATAARDQQPPYLAHRLLLRAQFLQPFLPSVQLHLVR